LTYKLVPLDEEHVWLIETDYDFPLSARQMFANHESVFGLSLFLDDELLACAGCHILWEGVAEGWIIMAKNGYGSPKTVARYTGKLFETIMNDNDLWRMQASVSVNDTRALRFADWLGFKDEGLMEKFGPDGGDYRRLARLRCQNQ